MSSQPYRWRNVGAEDGVAEWAKAPTGPREARPDDKLRAVPAKTPAASSNVSLSSTQDRRWDVFLYACARRPRQRSLGQTYRALAARLRRSGKAASLRDPHHPHPARSRRRPLAMNAWARRCAPLPTYACFGFWSFMAQWGFIFDRPARFACGIMSASPRERPNCCAAAKCRDGPEADSCTAAKSPKFDRTTLALWDMTQGNSGRCPSASILAVERPSRAGSRSRC